MTGQNNKAITIQIYGLKLISSGLSHKKRSHLVMIVEGNLPYTSGFIPAELRSSF